MPKLRLFHSIVECAPVHALARSPLTRIVSAGYENVEFVSESRQYAFQKPKYNTFADLSDGKGATVRSACQSTCHHAACPHPNHCL